MENVEKLQFLALDITEHQEIPPRSEKKLVSDAVLRDIGLVYVVPLHTFALYTRSPSKGKKKK
uniref:Uncharacterized protein n=1 Tax=Brassica oleracea var. oleracea TaxID=109376 RepID=A0A0D3BU86_BRAOL